MHRLIALAVLAAFVIAPAALAKERNIALTGKPSATTAGKTWTATVSITRDRQPDTGQAPTIRLLNNSISTAGRVVNVTTRATDDAGRLPRPRRVPERGHLARRRHRPDDRPRVSVRADEGARG